MATGGGLQPFDTHHANVGALEQSSAHLAKQAARAIDVNRLSLLAFLPAVDNWDGIAASELRAAPQPVRKRALELSESLSWASTTVRFWATQVTIFNNRVKQVRADLAAAKGGVHEAADAADDPPPAAELAGALEAVENAARQEWWAAYDAHIDQGGRTVASMLDDGATPSNVAQARAVGLLPSSGGWNPLMPIVGGYQGLAPLLGAGLGGLREWNTVPRVHKDWKGWGNRGPSEGGLSPSARRLMNRAERVLGP